MIKINFNKIDWLSIRQSISLSLLSSETINIKNGHDFLMQNRVYEPVVSDLMNTFRKCNIGELFMENGDIIFRPGKIESGIYEISTGPFSSSVEVCLSLVPALCCRDFRSVIKTSGVTHSSISCPVNFLQETVFYLLENIGIYAGFSLKRFGFYGTGGGKIEAAVYPVEKRNNAFSFNFDNVEPVAARIYISHLGSNVAKTEKSVIGQCFDVVDDKISIIEIMDSDGPGNAVQYYVNTGSCPVVFTRVIDMFDIEGDRIPGEKQPEMVLESFAREVINYLNKKEMPDPVIREIIPYIVLRDLDNENCFKEIHLFDDSINIFKNILNGFVKQ